MKKQILSLLSAVFVFTAAAYAPVSQAQSTGWSVETTDSDGNTTHHPRNWSIRKAAKVCENYEESGKGECKPVKNDAGVKHDPECDDPTIQC